MKYIKGVINNLLKYFIYKNIKYKINNINIYILIDYE